ncbi:CPK8 [Symbiodinium sp. CCMP2456]|nr:CPK8 [Symbiodinium sp. CCMP2456]
MSAFLRTLVLCTLTAWTSAVKHTGYIYDRLCIERGVGIDGVDGRRQPERHTVHCLLVGICQNSGFGILTKPSGADLWSFEVLFSDRGNADVITWLGTQEYWGTEVRVEVEGSLDGSGHLHVDSIKRLNDGSVWQGSGAAGEDFAHSVKNTFIEISDIVESPLRRTRAHSWCGTRVQVAVPIEGPEFGSIDDDDGEAQSLPGSFDSAQHSGSCFAGSGSNASASGSGRSQGSQLDKLSCAGRGGRSEAAPGAASQAKKARGGNQRWWEELSDTCPISGFPIAYLPYPPCKLQVGPGKSQKFVDGQYLLLHILSTLNFEVLGRSLTHGEIEAVDQHIKKCKLSPLRLSRAVELLCQVGQHNDRARQELAELRTKATKKLGALRHIQRVRMQRGDCSGMPAQPGRVDTAQPGPSQAKGKGRSGKANRPKGRTN